MAIVGRFIGLRFVVIVWVCLIGGVSAGPAQTSLTLPDSAVPVGARLVPDKQFDPAAATAAYLATLPAAQRERGDSYTEGGYWIQLWGFLFSAAILLGLLHFGWSSRLRDWVERRTRHPWLRPFLYYAVFMTIVTVIAFPFTVYVGFLREHHYGFATQGFSGWLRDQFVALLVSIVLGGIAVAIIYAVLRRFPRRWPMLLATAAIVFVVIGAAIGPVFIAPLFNQYTLLKDPAIREPILRIARANGISTDKVYVVDASRQTNRISANVSGLLGTQRITLNDNLLNRASLPEIEAVMAHEVGHYALRHIALLVVFYALLIVAGVGLLRATFAFVTERWGQRWGVRGIDDPAGLPLLVFLTSGYFFVLTPVINTYIRTVESTADIFGLNAARRPDAFAAIALKLGEYRKMDPGPVEEFIFYDHPSGKSRIRMAMDWKAAEETSH